MGAQGLHEEAHILAVVMPLKSHKVAHYIEKRVSGIIVPDAIVDKLR
ncbi:MAG: hypothetical protein MUO18_06685 [Methanomassiliicoccales archaeon]|nr:hypothetical protein [Methanomassiliicoccales archaeon]